MVRVKCVVSYDGSKFHGFQVQNKLRTVQGEIQKALKNIWAAGIRSWPPRVMFATCQNLKSG